MKFEIKTAEEIAALSPEDLAAYITAAKAAARAIAEDDTSTLDDIAHAEAVNDSAVAAQTVADDRVTAEDDRAARLAALRDATAPDEDDEDLADEHVDEVEPEVVEEVKVPVLAAATTGSPAARAARRQPKVVVPEQKAAATITAAADIPGVSTGAVVPTLKDLNQPTFSILSSLSRAGENAYVTKGIASVNLGRTDGLVGDKQESFQEALERASKESRLEGGSLIAAGGWCAPSETLYDLCGEESTDGLWDVPSIQVNRGGLNFTKGPQWSDFYASTFFKQTEAQAISGTTKACATISCPSFTDVRLDVMGVCVNIPILTEVAYPELVQRWLSGILVAHRAKIQYDLLTRAIAYAGSAVPVVAPWPTLSGTLLASLELVIQGERQRWRLGLNETLEVVFPFWVKGAVRADLSIRNGVDFLSVTDQQIEAWFTQRGARSQFVYDWQPLVGSSAGAGPVLDYPTTLQYLVYPAGTFVAGTKDVITLNGVYDSTGLSTNTYTGLFTEEGVSLMNVCRGARLIQTPVDITGLVANTLINQDYGVAAPKVLGTAIPLA